MNLDSTGELKSISKRYLSVDSWRGIACLMVVVFHSTRHAVVLKMPTDDGLVSKFFKLTELGWIGVPIFFVISGYCITASADVKDFSKFDARRFFLRRFRRIYPPYWMMIFLLSLVGIVVYIAKIGFLLEAPMFFPPWWRTPTQWLGNLTLTEEWRSIFFGSKRSMILGVAWTLCYEEQFYLIIGIIAWLSSSRRIFFTSIAAVTLITIPFFGNRSIQGLFFDGQWLSFALGVMAYYLIQYGNSHRVILSLLIVLPSSVWAANSADFQTPNDPYASFFVASIYSQVLMFLHPYDSATQEIRAVRVLNWFGTCCYSLYLVHNPIVYVISRSMYESFGFKTPSETLFLTLPLCLIASILAGGLFYRAVESKFLNLSS